MKCFELAAIAIAMTTFSTFGLGFGHRRDIRAVNNHIELTATEPKPRRLLRFSLRTLLLFTAIAACLLGVQVNKAHKQRAAVAAIWDAGGYVGYSWQRDIPCSDVPIDISYPWLRSLMGHDYFDTVYRVDFDEWESQKEGLVHLKKFPHLEHVYLRHASITDGDLRELSNLTSITNLTIESPRHF